jgi:hypothetical protein
MKTKTNSSSLASQFAAWRKRQSAAKITAFAVVSSVCSSPCADDAEKVFRSEKFTERKTDDDIRSGDEITLSPSIHEEIDPAPARDLLLSRAEREELETTRPASVSVVFRRTPAPVADVSAPLPPDFVPSAVSEFVPATAGVVFSEEELAEIEREAAAEIAVYDAEILRMLFFFGGEGFRSDFAPKFAPIDYTPGAFSVIE